jgi:hypothetical protein
LSAIVGIPAEIEKRTVSGVDELTACGALVSFAASAEGVKIPEYVTPRA